MDPNPTPLLDRLLAASPLLAPRRVAVHDLSRVAYREAFELQTALQAARIEGRCGDVLLFCEHEPVFTVTRRVKPAHRLWDEAECARRGIAVVDVDRGGDITYHGPGQVVGYAILALADYKRDVGWFMSTLEQVVIDACLAFGVRAGREQGWTGVWIDPADAADGAGGKVCAMGVRLSRWVSKHGFAFNVAPDLSHYAGIVPCGIANRPVTSLQCQLGARTPDRAAVVGALTTAFAQRFGATIAPIEAGATATDPAT